MDEREGVRLKIESCDEIGFMICDEGATKENMVIPLGRQMLGT